MIAFLRGRLTGRTPTHALVDVGGVGYEVAMPTRSLAALPGEGEPVTVLTHMHVREDGMSLFGFTTDAEKRLFEGLIGVSGVGPKVALAMLSALSPDDLASAVAREDVGVLSSVPGVGKKTAQRVIVDLKDRLGGPDVGALKGTVADVHTEAREALLAMGFGPVEAAAALKDVEGEDAQALLRAALRRLGGAA